MKNGKSCGLDGIPFEWYKKFWKIIGHDLHDVFLYSTKTGKLPTTCRQGVITLLPKNGVVKKLTAYNLIVTRSDFFLQNAYCYD